MEMGTLALFPTVSEEKLSVFDPWVWCDLFDMWPLLCWDGFLLFYSLLRHRFCLLPFSSIRWRPADDLPSWDNLSCILGWALEWRQLQFSFFREFAQVLFFFPLIYPLPMQTFVFIYLYPFGLCWISVATWGLSLHAASGAYSWLWCMGGLLTAGASCVAAEGL